MATATRHRGLSDTYFALVRQFPLTQLRNDSHLRAAQAMIDSLLTERLDRGAREYLAVLTDLVEAYEEAHEPVVDVSEAEVLRELMRSHGLTPVKLAKQVGMAPASISAVLAGTRSLTKDQVVKMARFFGISPVAFLPR